jgi:hypothetical protein
MSFEIGDGMEKITEWIMAIPNSIPILLGADPHNASLVRAMAALLLIAFLVYLIATNPLRSILALFKNRSSKGDKPD